MVPAVVGADLHDLGNPAALHCDSHYLLRICRLKCSLIS